MAKVLDFQVLKRAISKQFELLQKSAPFRVELGREASGEETGKQKLWELYLASFPPGTDPVLRVNTDHNCSCCRSFVKSVGDMVAIIGGKMVSIWDVKVPEEPAYQIVVNALSAFVKSKSIVDLYRNIEPKIGVDKNFEKILDAAGKYAGQTEWNHFYVNVQKDLVVAKDQLPTFLGTKRQAKELFKRALDELKRDDVDSVLELIAQNSIYRGAEFKPVLERFRLEQGIYSSIPDAMAKEQFAWVQSQALSGAVTGIRNTAIGSLLVDLAEGKDLDNAVKAYEFKVAPANYKRPTALVTPAMITKAKATIAELGLSSALQRRFATLADITINNVLFADRSARPKMGGDVFDDLLAAVPAKVKNLDKVEEITIDKFLADVLPKAETIEVFLENKHASNMVSLIAPEDATAGQMFKWSNRFSWSYAGELADSDMRKAVQARGGSVTGVFRFTHQWNYDKRNASLMDLHVFMPGSTMKAESPACNDNYGNGRRIGWNARNDEMSLSGGVQDVDFVDAAPVGYVPVENITFPMLARMPEGTYICKVHNWNLRQPTQGGFKAEIEFGGNVYAYEHDKPMKNKEWVTVAEVTLKAGNFDIKHHLPHGDTSKPQWGLTTQQFHKVSALMMSPNFWDDQQGIGNKHFFFMLQGAVNDGSARGFFNEFLRPDLDQHRKVFEMVGSKMTAAADDQQLSGLGFSSTQRNSLLCRVKGSTLRTLKVTF